MGAQTRIVGRTPPAIVSYGDGFRSVLNRRARLLSLQLQSERMLARFQDPDALGLTPKGRAERLARREAAQAGS